LVDNLYEEKIPTLIKFQVGNITKTTYFLLVSELYIQSRLRVVVSIVFDNVGTSNSSKQHHGQPPVTKIGLMVSAPPHFLSNFLLHPRFNCRDALGGVSKELIQTEDT
jgi:hypothetical protein